MGFSPTQKAMAIAPKFTGFLSICSSTFIIFYVLRDRKRRNLTYHRLLLGMSMSDFVGSMMCFLSTWPIPRGEAYLAAGTVQTCAAAGFFNQTAALCTPTYNISLAVYYILVIVLGWKENRVKKMEKYLHALPIVAGFSTGLTALIMKLFNGAGWICWIASGLPNHPERYNPNFGVFRLAFLYGPAWFIICFLAVVMATIYVSVLKQEKKLDKYMTNLSQKKRNNSRKIRNQAFLYVGCMYMTWLFGSIFRFMQFAGKTPPNAIAVLFVTFFPLQGFFNLIVYMYPRIVRYFEVGTPFTASFGNSMVLSSIRRLRSQTSTTFESRRASASSFVQEESGAIIAEQDGSNVIDANNSAEEGAVVGDTHESKVHFAQGKKDDDTPFSVDIADEGGEPDQDVNNAVERDAMDELVRIVEA